MQKLGVGLQVRVGVAQGEDGEERLAEPGGHRHRLPAVERELCEVGGVALALGGVLEVVRACVHECGRACVCAHDCTHACLHACILARMNTCVHKCISA